MNPKNVTDSVATNILSLDVLMRRIHPYSPKNFQHEDIIPIILKRKKVRLDREKIAKIDNLELLGNEVTHLYLQHNYIKKIENLETLPNLSFLILSGNRIRTVENLTALKSLALLDLSENLISEYDIDEFPKSLIILNLRSNPCVEFSHHRQACADALPNLKQLDEIDLTEGASSPVQDDYLSRDDLNDDERNNTLGQTTNGMLNRSQRRLEEFNESHQSRLSRLKEIKQSLCIPYQS